MTGQIGQPFLHQPICCYFDERWKALIDSIVLEISIDSGVTFKPFNVGFEGRCQAVSVECGRAQIHRQLADLLDHVLDCLPRFLHVGVLGRCKLELQTGKGLTDFVMQFECHMAALILLDLDQLKRKLSQFGRCLGDSPLQLLPAALLCLLFLLFAQMPFGNVSADLEKTTETTVMIASSAAGAFDKNPGTILPEMP